MTLRRYLFDDRLEMESVVTAVNPPGAMEDDNRPSLTLSETPFQHEDAWRSADRGAIDGAPVTRVLCSSAGEVTHHLDRGAHRFRAGQRVLLTVDPKWRSLIARTQCAGRLIELVVKAACRGMRPLRARYKPHQGFVEFGAESYPTPALMESAVRRCLDDLIRLDAMVTVTGDPGYPGTRRIRIGDYPAFPCDAVYPRSVGEGGEVMVHCGIVTGGRLRVHYSVAPCSTNVVMTADEPAVVSPCSDTLPSPYGLFY